MPASNNHFFLIHIHLLTKLIPIVMPEVASQYGLVMHSD
jgi:hypothetical protein